LGIWVLPAFGLSCGAGFGSALQSSPGYANAWAETGTVVGVIEYSLRGLGNVRYFFLFILAWTMVAGNVFNMYSISLSMQICGKYAARLPHFVYASIAVVVIALLAIIGKNSVNAILSNLVSVISYWTIIFFIMILEEHVIFRRRIGYALDAYANSARLGHGLAAMLAFGIGAAGAILGMSQSWFEG
jgi:purine-cytosine permease-like protein